MFFSANSERFASIHPELVRFVLDWRATGLSPKYEIDLVLSRGRFARTAGVYGAVNAETGRVEVASEVAHSPFALRLIFGDSEGLRRGPIEHFAQYGPDEVRERWLHTVAGHLETKFPGDYRNRERVDWEAAQGDESDGQ
jgi:hypothetical protein